MGIAALDGLLMGLKYFIMETTGGAGVGDGEGLAVDVGWGWQWLHCLRALWHCKQRWWRSVS